jgi:hypothetical protein
MTVRQHSTNEGDSERTRDRKLDNPSALPFSYRDGHVGEFNKEVSSRQRDLMTAL